MEDTTIDDNKKLFERTREELLAQQRSNSEIYDKSLLSLSSAFLGLSIAFISDIVPINTAENTLLLYLSWALLSLTIILTISSFIYAQHGIKKLIEAAREFYIERDDGAYFVSERISKNIELFNVSSGLVFIGAIILTVTFVLTNITRIENMTTEDKVVTGTEKKSQPTNTFQKPETGGQSGSQNGQTQQTTQTNNANKK